MSILGISVFPSRGLYGPRNARHVAVYMSSPGYFFLEFQDWTLEVDLMAAMNVRKTVKFVAYLAAVVLIPSPFNYSLFD